MSCVATFTIFPMDKGHEPSLAPYVADALKIIKGSGLSYELGSMGTVLEGEFGQIMDVVKECHDSLREVSDRIYLTLAIDSKSGDGGRIVQKVKSVEDCF